MALEESEERNNFFINGIWKNVNKKNRKVGSSLNIKKHSKFRHSKDLDIKGKIINILEVI